MWPRIRIRVEDWLFAADAAQAGRLARLLRGVRYPYALVRDLLRGELNLHAMGLVYATLLAAIPLVAFCFAVLRVFGAHRDLEPLIFEFFKPMGSAAGEFTHRVMDFADKVRGGLVGSVGLALLLWTLVSAMKKVEDSLNFVWRVEQARSFTRRLAEYLALLVIGPLLVAVVVGAAQMATRSHSLRSLDALPWLADTVSMLINLGPYLVVSALITVLYVFIPNTRVQTRAALIGGVGAGLVWAAIGKLFTAFVLYSARLTIVYAGFAIVIAALVWTYLGWLILLLGAQLSFYVQNPNYLRFGLQELQLGSAESERLALAIMALVARQHEHGLQRFTPDRLAERLGLPGITVARMTRQLEAATLLASTENEELLLGRDAGQILLGEVLSVARRPPQEHGAAGSGALITVDAFCAMLEAGWREQCAGRTLRELLGAR